MSKNIRQLSGARGCAVRSMVHELGQEGWTPESVVAGMHTALVAAGFTQYTLSSAKYAFYDWIVSRDGIASLGLDEATTAILKTATPGAAAKRQPAKPAAPSAEILALRAQIEELKALITGAAQAPATE